MDWEIGSNRIERPHFQVCCDWYVHGSKPPPPQVFCAATRTVSPPISKLKKSTFGFNLLQLGSWGFPLFSGRAHWPPRQVPELYATALGQCGVGPRRAAGLGGGGVSGEPGENLAETHGDP